jgi:sulfur-carrier protein
MAVTVTVRYWAGARRAAGTDAESISANSIADIRAHMQRQPSLSRLSEIVSFLVDGRQASDATALHDGAEVDVLPPFAGGC